LCASFILADGVMKSVVRGCLAWACLSFGCQCRGIGSFRLCCSGRGCCRGLQRGGGYRGPPARERLLSCERWNCSRYALY
jgi:hypothetical protein